MEMLWHTVVFLAVLSVIVVFSVVVENLYWRKNDPEKICGPLEIIGNFFLGSSYKLIDALAIFPNAAQTANWYEPRPSKLLQRWMSPILISQIESQKSLQLL